LSKVFICSTVFYLPRGSIGKGKDMGSDITKWTFGCANFYGDYSTI